MTYCRENKYKLKEIREKFTHVGILQHLMCLII